MSSSEEAGGLKELANNSISSRNLVAGMPRSFFPSVMDSRLMLAISSSPPCLVIVSGSVEVVSVVLDEDMVLWFPVAGATRAGRRQSQIAMARSMVEGMEIEDGVDGVNGGQENGENEG